LAWVLSPPSPFRVLFPISCVPFGLTRDMKTAPARRFPRRCPPKWYLFTSFFSTGPLLPPTPLFGWFSASSPTSPTQPPATPPDFTNISRTPTTLVGPSPFFLGSYVSSPIRSCEHTLRYVSRTRTCCRFQPCPASISHGPASFRLDFFDVPSSIPFTNLS